jgi:hypothetical protein
MLQPERESKLPNCPCLLSGCCWLKPHVIQSLHKGIGHDEAYWVGSGRRRREWEARQGGIWIGESKKDVNEEKLNAKKKQKTPMFHKSWGQLKVKTHFNPQNANNIFTPNNALWVAPLLTLGLHLALALHALISAMSLPPCFCLNTFTLKNIEPQ